MKKTTRLLTAILCLALLIGLAPAPSARAEIDWKSLPYWIGVDLANQRTTIYRTSDNSVVHCWICSTGANNRTPTGTFYLPEARGRQRSEWFPFTNSWVKYAVRYYRGLYFHSIIFHEAREGTATSTSIANLGKAVSHGCVRLKVPAARWLCYNCPTGTRVIIHRGVNDPSIVEALGRSAETTLTDTSGLPGAVRSVKVIANGSTSLTVGDKLKLTTELNPSNTYTSYSWKSSSKKVAKVDGSGNVTAVGQGTARITVTTANGRRSSVTVSVYDPGLPSSVTLDKSGTVMLKKGETLQLKATMAPATAVSALTWTSSRKKVAIVNGSGLVTAEKEGTTVIRVATRNRKKASVKIRVVDPYKVASVWLNHTGTVTLKPGETLQLKPGFAPDTAVPGTLKWTSSRKKVAIVDENGLVTAKKKGKARITVRTANGKKATVTINVVN